MRAAALLSSADELDHIFETGLIGMAICDFRGDFVRVNGTFARMLGRTTDWFPGRSVSEISHPDDRRADLLQLRLLREGRHPGTIRAERHVHADGHIVWGDTILHVIPPADGGEPEHFLMQVRDITQELDNESEISRQRQRLEASQAAANVGTWEHNPKTGQRYWSKEMKRLHLLPPDAPTPSFEEFMATVHPDDRGMFEEQADARERYEYVYRLIRDPENVRTIRMFCEPQLDENGDVEWFLGADVDITEDAAVRAELHATIEELNKIFDGGLLAAAVCDMERRFVRVNDALCQMVGRPREWFTGRRVADIAHPDDVDQDDQQVRQLRYLHADGRVVWGDTLVHAIPAVDGQPQHHLLQIRDITHEIEAEAELAKRQERLDLSQAAAHVGTWEVDFATLELTWSDEYARIHGHDPSEPTPPRSEWSTWLPPDDLERVLTAFRSHEFIVIEYTILHGPNAPRHVVNRSRYIPGENGHPGYRVGVIIDVTEERRRQDALQQAEEQFRLAFENSLIGMMVLKAGGRRLLVNDALCQMLGYDRETLLGLSIAELNHPDDLDEDVRLMELLSTGQTESYVREKRFRHADGHYVWAEVHVAVMPVASDDEPQLIAHVRDITEARAHQEQLRYLAEHDPLTGLLNRRAFEQRVRERLAGQEKVNGAFLMIDLDSFKYHNDTYGHAVGDAILRKIAEEIPRTVPAGAIVGRLGGDEFAVALEDVGEAMAVAELLLTRISGAAAIASPDEEHPVTASIGIADFSGAPTVQSVMVRADHAMYAAKAAGRNQVKVAPLPD